MLPKKPDNLWTDPHKLDTTYGGQFIDVTPFSMSYWYKLVYNQQRLMHLTHNQ